MPRNLNVKEVKMRTTGLTGLFALALVAFLAGCSTTVAHDSESAVFGPYLGKTLPLLVAQRLCKMPDDKNFYAVRQIRLVGTKEYCPNKLAELPVGTKVFIQNVSKEWMAGSGSMWYAMGKVVGTGEEFEYPWAYMTVRRAPWDAETVPEVRSISR
jgi:hypothetical protein